MAQSRMMQNIYIYIYMYVYIPVVSEQVLLGTYPVEDSQHWEISA